MAQSTQTLTYHTVPQSTGLGWRLVAWLGSWLVGVVLVLLILGWRYGAAYNGRIFEGVSVNGVVLDGLTPAQATTLLTERLPNAENEQVILRVGSERWVATTSDLGIHLDAPATAAAAFQVGREGSGTGQWLERFALWRGRADPGRVQPLYTRDPVAVESLVARIANEVARDPQDATLTIQGLSVSARTALPGRQLDVVASQERLVQALATNQTTVELVVTERAPHIIGAEEAAAKAEALLSTPLVFFLEQPEYRATANGYEPTTARRQWMVDRARLAEMLLVFSEPLESGQYTLDVKLKPEGLRAEVERLAADVQRPAREARFDFDPATGTLTPLVVSQEGLALNVEDSMQAIEQALAEGQHEVALAVTTIAPQVATTDASKMNITGLAVTGFSNYTGSPTEREVNLSVAATQYQGIVIPPGGIFSFNDNLGWVVDANGYEEGYIISGNKTEVDVGGGVCQVSTTVFRAAFNAGFEIVERNPHAYRVPYYENGSPVGWDATIFSPVVDFKFRNDTPNYYVMEVNNNRSANTLEINLYGPPTNRDVQLGAKTVETVPHGPPIYTDDPTLPTGVVKQVDWEHDGATVVIYRVVRDATTGAELRRDEFWSKYRPWVARYQVGTAGQ